MSSSPPIPVPVLLMVRELGIGGTERQLVETARFLQRERFTPHVGCFRPDGPRRCDLERAGVPILHLPMHSFPFHRGGHCRVTADRDTSASIDIQVVHSFDAPLNIFAVPIAKFAGAPAVISSQRGHRDLTGGLNKRCLRVTDRLTDAVVVNCEAMRRYLVEDEGVAESKIRICHNAVDVEQYRRRTTAVAVAGQVRDWSRYARCARKRGWIRCCGRLRKLSRQDAMLAIVGSGPEEPRLTALAAELGISAALSL